MNPKKLRIKSILLVSQFSEVVDKLKFFRYGNVDIYRLRNRKS